MTSSGHAYLRRSTLCVNAVKSCGMGVVDEFFGGGCSSCADCAGQWNQFELIPAVKMESGHPVEGLFGREFQRPVIVAELMAA